MMHVYDECLNGTFTTIKSARIEGGLTEAKKKVTDEDFDEVSLPSSSFKNEDKKMSNQFGTHATIRPLSPLGALRVSVPSLLYKTT